MLDQLNRPLTQTATRAEVEDLLFEEAACLDEWRLDDWLKLLTDDATYEIPSTDRSQAEGGQSLPLILDDNRWLRERVKQLLGGYTWVEQPRSRTRRLLGNVRVLGVEGEDIHVQANFVIHRLRSDTTAVYVGHYENVLRRCHGVLKIHRRRSVLDNESLKAHGAIAFIL